MAKTTAKAFLSGNESLAQGAWEAGLQVACAYPGTPSSEIAASPYMNTESSIPP